MKNTFVLLLLLGAVFSENINPQNKNEDNRVSSPATAHPGQFPFVVSLYHADTFLCGGALISSNWVLTSAICIWGFQSEVPSQYYIRAGTVLLTHEPGAQYVRASRVVTHPDFQAKSTLSQIIEKPSLDEVLPRADPWLYYNNIGLIELVQPVAGSGTVAPVAMAFATETILPGLDVIMAGWGGSNDETHLSRLEYSTTLQIIDLLTCTLLVPGSQYDTDHICTGAYPQSTACSMDHGGPLFRYDPIQGTVLLGVINYAPCLDSGHPTIYASLPAQRYWISTVTGF